MKSLHPAAKVAIVALGFAAAGAASWLAVAVRQLLADPADLQASSGMHAEGEAMLGLLVFCGLGALPLSLGLYWLRVVPQLWRGMARVAVACACTIPLSFYAFHSPGQSPWLMVIGLRVLAAPIISGFWLIWGLFAPAQRERWMLLSAALAEGTLFAVWLLLTVLNIR